MAKTKRTIIIEEKRKEPEPPSHKHRREQEAKIRDVIRHGPRFEDDDYEDFETFEPIRARTRA